MGGFFYFTPKTGGLGQFYAAGLGYAFEAPPAQTEVGTAVGPSGLPGMVYHAADEGIPAGLVWHLMAPHWWIGHAAGRKPTPGELSKAKNSVSRGYSVTLGDGEAWTVPVVIPCQDRDPGRQTGLPQVYQTAAGGEVPEGQPIPQFLHPAGVVKLATAAEYADLTRQAQAFLANLESALTDTPAEPPTPQATLNFCTACLAVTYRIRTHEAMALGLYTQESVNEIVFAAIDAAERMLAKAETLGHAEAIA